ncbi:hypothetical protein V8B55DRAFT_1411649 [Mucor lusitanicus]|nr:hypothetical protein FB192DRAFT_1339710 [Mucor lusitanicus]
MYEKIMHLLSKKCASFRPLSEKEACAKKGLQQTKFSASKDSPWPIVYFALLDVVKDFENLDDSGDDYNVMDEITNGVPIEWETVVPNFINFLKSSPNYKPTRRQTNKKRLRIMSYLKTFSSHH